MAKGTHDYVDDPRNQDIKININGEFFAREDGKISVFDSGYILGDGIWAPWWYASVEKSTGFMPYKEQKIDLPAELERLAEKCMPIYEKLMKFQL